MGLLYESITILLNLIEVLILVRIVFSFLNIRGNGVLTKLVYELTEPILGPSRELASKLGLNKGMFDFSPLIAIFMLRLAHYVITRIL